MKKILLVIIILFITGCNYRELNDIAVVTAISVDRDKDGYKTIVQVINPTKEQDSTSSGEPDFITYTSTGKTLQESFRKVMLESPRKIYGSQMQLLIIGEELARDGIGDILDFFFRDPEIRFNFNVVVEKKNSDNKAIKTLTVLDNLSSSNIMDSIKNASNYIGNSIDVTFEDLMNMYLYDNLEIVLPSIYAIGNDNYNNDSNLSSTSNYSKVIVSNLSIFKDDKLQGYLTFNESIGYNFITDNIKDTLVSFECDNGRYLVSEIINNNSDIETDVIGRKIIVTIHGNASINENNCDYNLKESSEIETINKMVNNKIEELVSNSANSIRNKYNSDIFGFRDLFYKKDYKEYNNIKSVWYEDVFNDIEVEVKSDIKLVEKGNIVGGIHDQ